MNSDVLGAIFGLLADCRGAGLCCTKWYAAYLLTPDSAVWLGPPESRAARVLPKMYPGAWRGSVFDLAAAGNIAPLAAFDNITAPSACRLLKIACERGDFDLIRWVNDRTKMYHFGYIIGQYGTVELFTLYGGRCEYYFNGAVVGGNVQLLWHLINVWGGAANRLNNIAVVTPERIHARTVQVAHEAGIIGQWTAMHIFIGGTVDAINGLAQLGYTAEPIAMDTVLVLYNRREYDKILWYCASGVVPAGLNGADIGQVHNILAPLEPAGAPDHYIMKMAPTTDIIRMTVVRKSMTLLKWLLDSGVTINFITATWQNYVVACSTNWITDIQVRAEVERRLHWQFDKKQAFRERCAAVGCDRAIAAGELPPRDDIMDVLDEFGRWDLARGRFCVFGRGHAHNYTNRYMQVEHSLSLSGKRLSKFPTNREIVPLFHFTLSANHVAPVRLSDCGSVVKYSAGFILPPPS